MANEPKYQSIDLSDLLVKRTRVVNVDLGDGLGITIRYKPNALTPAIYAGLDAAQNATEAKADPFALAGALIVPLLDSWSLTDGGKPYPITAETVSALGIVIVTRLGKELMADLNAVMSPEETAELKKASAA
jgi:hypothetical protein